METIDFERELKSRRTERQRSKELLQVMFEASEAGATDAQLHSIMMAGIDAKILRMSAQDFEEYELEMDADEAACWYFIDPFNAYTWSLAKEFATGTAR